MAARPLLHVDAEKKGDETLRAEARAHLAEAPSLQLVAELLAKLRAAALPFWSPQVLRDRWSAAERMRWYRQRPDLRQGITTRLTGLAAKAARKKMPDFQAALIDSVIDEGDIPVRAFEDSFEPSDLSVYGSAPGFWHAMRELFPWHDDAPPHQAIVAWLLKALISDTSSIPGMSRVPILTSWDLRTSIEGRVWHTRIPLEVRVAIDDARLSLERDRPGAPFHAQDDLAIAVPDIIAASVPLRDLAGVLDAAERAMGFDREAPRPKGPPDLKPPVDDGAPGRDERGVGHDGAASAPKAQRPKPPAETPSMLSTPSTPPPMPSTPPPPMPSTPPPASPPPPGGAPGSNDGAPARSSAQSVTMAPQAPPNPSAPSLGANPKETAKAGRSQAPGAAVEPVSAAPAPAVAIAAGEVRKIGPSAGVPTLEDELERTNPWVVPSPEEMAAAAAEETASYNTETAPSKLDDGAPGRASAPSAPSPARRLAR
jgi:hypothetical protein